MAAHIIPVFWGPDFKVLLLLNYMGSPKKKTIIGGGDKWVM